MAEWVDFKAVKDAVSMQMILTHYGIDLRKVNQTSLRGNCPLPTHGDNATKESFSVSTAKNAWACQSASCKAGRDGKAGGNVLDFVAVREGCGIRDGALKIQEWFGIEASNKRPKDYVPSRDRKKETSHKKNSNTAPKPEPTETTPDVEDEGEVNQPLEFQLKSIDTTHPYIRQRGINPETAEHFGIGYFNGRGSMTGRLVIPIHNEDGKLIAYAGRSVDDSEPKYKLPAGFRKSLVLYNFHQAITSCPLGRGVIIVEGFFDCMKIHQAEFRHVVALMGSSLSGHQEKLLVENFDRVVVMLDDDEGGRLASSQIVARLADKMFVRRVNLPDSIQPDTLSSKEIQNVLHFLD